jgi:hypothetical protein
MVRLVGKIIMALPPTSFAEWLEEPRCPACDKVPPEIPESQRVICTCETEFIVLKARNSAQDETIVFWSMPASEFYENINQIWQQLGNSRG